MSWRDDRRAGSTSNKVVSCNRLGSGSVLLEKAPSHKPQTFALRMRKFAPAHINVGPHDRPPWSRAFSYSPEGHKIDPNARTFTLNPRTPSRRSQSPLSNNMELPDETEISANVGRELEEVDTDVSF